MRREGKGFRIMCGRSEPPYMGHVFISCSSSNSAVADRLTATLRSHGVNTWIYRDRIAAGAKWPEEIVEAIRTADAVLVLLSDDAVRSEEVAKEIAIASGAGRLILPLEIERVKDLGRLTYHLANVQRIDLTKANFESGLKSLLAALGRRVKKRPKRPKPPRIPEPVLYAMVVLVLIGVVAIGVSIWPSDKLEKTKTAVVTGTIAPVEIPQERVPTPWMDKQPPEHVTGLEWSMRYMGESLLAEARKRGIELRIIRGFETPEAQRKLYERGRKQPGSVVTNSKGGDAHHVGLAIDIAVVRDGKPVMDDESLKTVGPIGRALGLTWGGDRNGPKNYSHFELAPPKTLGQRSTSEAGAAAPCPPVSAASTYRGWSGTEPQTSIAKRTRTAIVEQLGVSADAVVPAARLREDLRADDLDIRELLMAFEEEFGVEIPDKDSACLKTAGDWSNYILSLASSSQSSGLTAHRSSLIVRR